jgi:phosphonate degradation associated HDIG domain protein
VTPVEELAVLFASQGAAGYLGEAVTQAQHMLQAGALAAAAGAPEALVAAALLHDVGHFRGHVTGEDLMGGIDNRHEEAGARTLRRWFGADVSEPVRLHVTAKRYLCHSEPQYYEALSPASKYTLEVQGGPMMSPQARTFEADRYFADAVALRRWDDQAKDPSVKAPAFEWFVPLLEALAEPPS